MFFNIQARVALIVTMVLASAGLLTGCVSVDPGPGGPSIGVTMPAIEPVPVDPSKSLEDHATWWKGEFAKIYCPLREHEIGDAIATEGERLWNEFAAEAQRQGAPIPDFDPGAPEMCQ